MPLVYGQNPDKSKQKTTDWTAVNRRNPCPVCEADGWCSVSEDQSVACCRREPNGATFTKNDALGAPCYFHVLSDSGTDPEPPAKRPESRPKGPNVPAAPVETRHAVYTAVLNALVLSAYHRETLRQRGLDNETITAFGYGSIPEKGPSIVKAILAQFDRETLLSVPGFHAHGAQLRFWNLPGLLIPVRDVSGQIVALLSRPDKKLDSGGKYLWISSKSKGGSSPGAPCHVPTAKRPDDGMVRLTEGALKADVATALNGMPTVGASSVANWRPTLPILRELGAKTVRVAFDCDATVNPHVALATIGCCEALAREGFKVEVERWDRKHGKGIDDVLAAHKPVEVLTGEALKTFLDVLRNGITLPTNERPSTPGPTPSRNGKASSPRPEIEVNTELHRMLAETLAVLPLDPDLYCRGNMLVRVVREQEKEVKLPGGVTVHNAAGMARVVPLGEAELACRLTALADFFVWHVYEKQEPKSLPATLPSIIIRAILGNGEYPGVRPLRAIASAPFPRPGGGLVTTPGYDAETGVYLSPGVALPPIPDHPTRADAEAAARRLRVPFQDFPFASENDWAVCLTATLGAIARPGIAGPVPGTAVLANLAGVGKGKLIDAIGIIATGFPVPTTSYPYDNTEAAKVKASFAIALTEIVHLDNIDSGSQYGNGALDSALTSTTVNERILGQSKQTGPIELRPSWFLSGNNISPGKDAHRRWNQCSLESKLEHPHERNDIRIPDLLAHVIEHRAELLHDALVIFQAHDVAGRKTDGWAPLGSFEQWDPIVRGAAWYATGLDCNTTRRKAAEDSQERISRIALLEAWQAMPGCAAPGHGMTSLKAFRLAAETDGATPPNLKNPDLADALLAFGKDGKPASSRTIGNTLRGIAGRNLDGKMFVTTGKEGGCFIWTVKTVDSPGQPEKGSEGSRGSDLHSPRIANQTDHNVMAHERDGKGNGEGWGIHPSDPSDPLPGFTRGKV
jgi:hypothetical protein